MPEIACKVCGKAKHFDAAAIRRGAGKYCSRECYYASIKRAEQFNCAICGKVAKKHAGRGKFCSRACTAESKRLADPVKCNPIYECWRGIKRRCLEPGNHNYPRYGGRGITVCDRWRNSFEAFVADMGPRPEGMTIDRIDNDGPYSPENCRWATPSQQATNRRNTILVEYLGREMSLYEYAGLRGVLYESVHRRIRQNGETPEEAADNLIRLGYSTRAK